mgnify:FL=1
MIRENVSTGLFRNLPLFILSAVVVAACEQKQASHDEIVKADLLVIIDSLGSPCGEVLEYQRHDELGYTIHCKSGDEYLISVDPQGRVGMESRK